MGKSASFKKRVDSSAFTLIEILVAVMIFGIIMLTIFSSFRSFMLSSQMIKSNIAASETIASFNNIMVRDFLYLRISLPPEYSKPISASSDDSDSDKFRFSGDETTEDGNIFSRVRFASLAHISFGGDIKKDNKASKRVGAARVIYYVRPVNALTQDGEDGFELCRSDTLNSFDDTDGSDCDPVICRNITKFKVTYMDIKGDKHHEWDSESDRYNYSTPVSVAIEIEFRIMDSLHTFSTTIAMPLFREYER